MGSSLGGFYATWLAERLGCRAVLLNPVVHAARDLATQVGSHRTFHGDEPFEFLPGYVDDLARAEADIQGLTRPEHYPLLAATGDEVLDWREMQARFAGSRQRIIEGRRYGTSEASPTGCPRCWGSPWICHRIRGRGCTGTRLPRRPGGVTSSPRGWTNFWAPECRGRPHPS